MTIAAVLYDRGTVPPDVAAGYSPVVGDVVAVVDAAAAAAAGVAGAGAGAGVADGVVVGALENYPQEDLNSSAWSEIEHGPGCAISGEIRY